MSGRAKTVRVQIDVKDRGTVWLRLTSDPKLDKYTIYLKGDWKLIGAEPSDDDIYENGPKELAEAVQGKASKGKFERQSGSDMLILNGTQPRIHLAGVDQDHGLSPGRSRHRQSSKSQWQSGLDGAHELKKPFG